MPILLSFILAFVLASCTSTPVNLDPDGLYAERPPDSIAGDGSVLFEQASDFDKALRAKLDATRLDARLQDCKKPSSDPFCPGYRKLKVLKALNETRSRIVTPPPAKVIAPMLPVFSAGKLKNLKQLREAPVENLLKGLGQVDSSVWSQLVSPALKAKRCPNNLAVALAATWEDKLPAPANPTTIAQLYEEGGRCAKKRPVDREHFLTRASLFYIWKDQCDKALPILQRINPTDAFSGRTLYWTATCQKKLGLTDASAQSYERLYTRHPFSFHALYAANERNVDLTVPWLGAGTIEEAKSDKAPKANAFIKQAAILKKYGFDYSAALIANWTFSEFHRLESKVRIYLSSLADPPTAISQIPFALLGNPSLGSRTALQIMFPRPFYEAFVRNADGVDPYLLLSIARKESRFNPNAVSFANAQGLMQIHPDTANRMRGGHPPNLFDPNPSIELASEHLRGDLGTFKQQLPKAIAAYNAGPEAVQSWEQRYPVSSSLLFIDLIPYRETRDYTTMVLSYYYWYLKLYDSRADKALALK